MCERLRPPVNMETFVAAGNLILTLDEGYQAAAAAGDSRAPGELGGISDIEGAERRLGVEQSRGLLTVGNGVDCRFFHPFPSNRYRLLSTGSACSSEAVRSGTVSIVSARQLGRSRTDHSRTVLRLNWTKMNITENNRNR